MSFSSLKGCKSSQPWNSCSAADWGCKGSRRLHHPSAALADWRLLQFYTSIDWTHRFYTYTTQIPVMVRTGRLMGSITQRDIFQHFVQPLSSFSSSASRAKSAQVELTFNWEWRTSAQPPTDSCPEGGGWVVGQLQERCYLLSWWMKERGSGLDRVIGDRIRKSKGWERWLIRCCTSQVTGFFLHFFFFFFLRASRLQLAT